MNCLNSSDDLNLEFASEKEFNPKQVCIVYKDRIRWIRKILASRIRICIRWAYWIRILA